MYIRLGNRTSVPTIYWDGSRDEFFSGHFSENLSYDNVGNITEDQRELGNLNYSFDPTNQLLTTALKNTGHNDWNIFQLIVDRTWKYDLTGNRLNDSLNGPGDFIANGIVSDKLNTFTSDPDGYGNVVGIQDTQGHFAQKLGYRADGELTHYSADWNQGWFFNSVNKFGTKYYFDALGRRIAKTHGYIDENDHSQCDLKHNKHNHEHYLTLSYSYLADQNKILMAKDAGGELSLYLDGQGIDDHLGEIRHGRARGYVVDHLGSVMNSAASGGVALFGAFGEMVGFHPSLALVSEPALYGYAGRQLDPESNLYYMRARTFSPQIGRFLQKDPIGFAGRDFNLYRYVGNNPLRFRDPTGFDGEDGFPGGSEIFFGGIAENFGFLVDTAAGYGTTAGEAVLLIFGGAEAAPDVLLVCANNPEVCGTLGLQFTSGLIQGLVGNGTGNPTNVTGTPTDVFDRWLANYLGQTVGTAIGNACGK